MLKGLAGSMIIYKRAKKMDVHIKSSVSDLYWSQCGSESCIFGLLKSLKSWAQSSTCKVRRNWIVYLNSILFFTWTASCFLVLKEKSDTVDSELFGPVPGIQNGPDPQPWYKGLQAMWPVVAPVGTLVQAAQQGTYRPEKLGKLGYLRPDRKACLPGGAGKGGQGAAGVQ